MYRHSPSPRRSRSPVLRRSRSPVYRRSRSPVYRRSRSPVYRRSRSPVYRRSRSPVYRRSRSPVYRRSRSPVYRRSRSPVYRRGPAYRQRSPAPHRYGDRRRSPMWRRGPPPRDRFRPRPVHRGTEEERRTTTAIYVGNLCYDVREQDIDDMFSPFGRVAHRSVPLDTRSGHNKGFAFVEFETRAEAEAAYARWDGAESKGRVLRLDWDAGQAAKNSRFEERESKNPDAMVAEATD